MIDKRCIFVFGPESSGTRLATRFLLLAGCAGDDGHEQAFDAQPPQGQPRVVWRRSFPHRRQWPSVHRLVQRVGAQGYRSSAVVMAREHTALVRSQLAAPHVTSSEEAHEHIAAAYGSIFIELSALDVPFVLLPYEALLLHPLPTLAGLYRALDLPCPSDLSRHVSTLYDGNAPHYD